MNKFWITFLLAVYMISAAIPAENVPVRDSSRQLSLKQNRQSGIKEKKPKQAEIIDLTFKIVNDNVLLSWQNSGIDTLSTFVIDRITGEESREAGQIRPLEQIEIAGEYTFSDPITSKDREEGKIIYRIRGTDTAGQMITQKQIMVEIKDESNGYSLDQNYPNPFNPVTTIEYHLPVQNHISIKIYNILGNHIATLVDETKPAGTYKTEFNGTGLTSGVYIYTLKAGEYTETKRMILMK